MTTNYKMTQLIYDNVIEKYGTCAVLIENFDSESAFIILNQCKCCERHRENRPKKFEIWDKNNQNQNATQKSRELQIANLNECACDCRHLSRWLCRGLTTDIICKKISNK